MRAIVVYESLWGNTEQVARAIAHGLESTMSVEVVDAESAPDQLEAYDLVVVGGPTHAFSMSRPSTREGTPKDTPAPRVVTRGIREWLGGLSPVFSSIRAVAFDTKVDAPRLPGSAAKAARHELRARGFDVTAKAETFRVHGYEGPLVDGELDRAAAWARELASQVTA
ncbi:MAG: flavodoxin domain-containing protein [Microcella sp.]|nr:flavodoxin domain-containing protein [Microcella sp.]